MIKLFSHKKLNAPPRIIDWESIAIGDPVYVLFSTRKGRMRSCQGFIREVCSDNFLIYDQNYEQEYIVAIKRVYELNKA
ncbi:MAG: hypothetical protein DRR08_24725 [Candidatus Parabeggiatoa sp. nov. 2]|nr:MAG: hypothetical protein B6247_29620 [Beggiatoa sp. 4572_84]RKZ55297.1 MAG: hypothetical protein DRR08_24725 [Gammaproteobacteria bacterium]